MEKDIDEHNNLELNDPRIDIIFKTIFKEPNEDITKSLINTLLPYDEEIVEKVSFNEPKISTTTLRKKNTTILDDLHFKESE